MLLCPEYCEIMEYIGHASLGASDEEIWQLTKVMLVVRMPGFL